MPTALASFFEYSVDNLIACFLIIITYDIIVMDKLPCYNLFITPEEPPLDKGSRHQRWCGSSRCKAWSRVQGERQVGALPGAKETSERSGVSARGDKEGEGSPRLRGVAGCQDLGNCR